MLFRRLLKIPYHIRDMIHYSRAFSRKEYTDMVVKEVDDDAYLLAAKKLHAKVYLARGFVHETEVDGGVISVKSDPHQLHSRYFVVTDKKSGGIIATSRQIEATRRKKHGSFASVGKAHLYPGALKRIKSHKPEEIIEISGLAKQRGVSKLAPLLLYRAMWHHSLRSRHKLWLLAVDTKLFVRLKLLFGTTIRKSGKVTAYYGGDVVPAILDLQSSITGLKNSLKKSSPTNKLLRLAIIRFMINGLPVGALNSGERKAHQELKEMIEKTGNAKEDEYRVFSLRFKVLSVAILASLAYTVVRFLFVKYTLEGYGVDPWFFLVLDAVAGVVYVLAIEKLIFNLIKKQDTPLRSIVAWTVIAAASFAAPYIYIFWSGSELSPGILYGLGVLIVLLVVNAVVTVRNRVRKKIAE